MGEAKVIEPRKGIEAVGLQKDPFATFRFRYRPIGMCVCACHTTSPNGQV